MDADVGWLVRNRISRSVESTALQGQEENEWDSAGFDSDHPVIATRRMRGIIERRKRQLFDYPDNQSNFPLSSVVAAALIGVCLYYVEKYSIYYLFLSWICR
jgi:hypothetical protein